MLPCSLYPSRLFFTAFLLVLLLFYNGCEKENETESKRGKKRKRCLFFSFGKASISLAKRKFGSCFRREERGKKSRLFFSLHRSIALRREGPNDGPSDPFHLGPSRIPSISQRKGREIQFEKSFLSSIALIRHKKVSLHSGQFAQLLFKKLFSRFTPRGNWKAAKVADFFQTYLFLWESKDY